jgi:5-methylcytosine-specific restriction protein A
MLCPSHHRIIHHTGWDVHIATSGLPEFVPPDWLDASRTPRRNPLQHQ